MTKKSDKFDAKTSKKSRQRAGTPNQKKHKEMGTTHITPVGGNIFLDLGFEPEEAAALLAESREIISDMLVKNKGRKGKP
jgi:hypothetical protein